MKENLLNNFYYNYYRKINNIEDNNNPKNLKYFKNIISDSYTNMSIDNTFALFQTIDYLFYIIYSTEHKSIICYNIINQKKLVEINFHSNFHITNFKHFFDKKKKRDLIISIIGENNSLKLWDVRNWNCLLNLTNINKDGWLDSACFLYDKNENYIITSNLNWGGISENIKFFNFEGKKTKELIDSNNKTFFIDVYYDDNIQKNFIIVGTNRGVKSYDYEKNVLYHKYSEDEFHFSIIVRNNRGIKELIDSYFIGYIKIYDFHSGSLIRKINLNEKLKGLCLWSNNYLFVGSDRSIILLDLTNLSIIKKFGGHENFVLTLKKIYIPQYGECLVSQEINNNIILWTYKIENKKD